MTDISKDHRDKSTFWTDKDVIKDAEMRRPDDPKYDPTTIHVPTEAWENFSGAKI